MSGEEQRPRADLAFAAFTRIEAMLTHVLTALRGAGIVAVAPESEARSQYGDCKIAMQMKSWDGPQYKDGRASDCPAAFLTAYADMLEGMALRTMAKVADRDNPEKLKFARYNLKDAALCRAWAVINKDKPVTEARQPAADWQESAAPEASPTPRAASDGDAWTSGSDQGAW